MNDDVKQSSALKAVRQSGFERSQARRLTRAPQPRACAQIVPTAKDFSGDVFLIMLFIIASRALSG